MTGLLGFKYLWYGLTDMPVNVTSKCKATEDNFGGKYFFAPAVCQEKGRWHGVSNARSGIQWNLSITDKLV